MSQETVSVPARNYASHIESRHGTKYSKLVEFLETGHILARTETGKRRFEIHILDTINQVVQQQHFVADDTETTYTNFSNALDKRPAEVITRLVIVQHDHLLLNQNYSRYVDSIGWKYKLDPLFFCRHFESSKRGGSPMFTVALPSERQYVLIERDFGSWTTATLVEQNDKFTVVIFDANLTQHHLPDRQKAITDGKRFCRDKIWSADANPCEFLLPYIEDSLRQAARGLANVERIRQQTLSTERMSTFNWIENQNNYRALLQSRDSLECYLDKASVRLLNASSFEGVLNDYKQLIIEAKENSKQLLALYQNYASHQAVKEAKKGLEQADAVRRITLIGIVFIPLNFATSFFGMNLRQLDTGTLNIGYFFLTALFSGLLAYMLAASIKPSERFWSRAKRLFGAREFGDPDVNGENYQWVTKSMMFNTWIQGRFPPAAILSGMWWEQKDLYLQECNELFEENILCFELIVLWRLLLAIPRKTIEKVRKTVCAGHLKEQAQEDAGTEG